MKKNLLLMAVVATAPLIKADPGDLKDFDPIKWGTIYYGTEATPNPNNPCKGATVRKCAEITNDAKSVGGRTLLTTTVKDGNGNIVSVTRDYYDKSPAQLFNLDVENLPVNATVLPE